MTAQEKFMRLALAQAREAFLDDETPVGAVIVRNGELVSVGRNRRENGKNALYHAEIEAIDSACKKLGGWRLWECEMYVTLEPCPMCAGAIVNARIRKLYFGAADPKNGAVISKLRLFDSGFTHTPEFESGILEEECAGILKEFFKKLRNKNKTKE